jgi:hypothetical protein
MRAAITQGEVGAPFPSLCFTSQRMAPQSRRGGYLKKQQTAPKGNNSNTACGDRPFYVCPSMASLVCADLLTAGSCCFD